MAQTNIYLDEEEEKIVAEYKEKHKINSKQDSIKKMIREFKKR